MLHLLLYFFTIKLFNFIRQSTWNDKLLLLKIQLWALPGDNKTHNQEEQYFQDKHTQQKEATGWVLNFVTCAFIPAKMTNVKIRLFKQ